VPSLTQAERRRRALATLKDLDSNPLNVLVVHYSCERFYDRVDPSSPRITSIAVRNLGNGQTVSFSIHQMAERAKVTLADLEEHYDVLEAKMLDEFSEFILQHPHARWLHWNMRDINYGFAALEHRAKTLGTEMSSIPEANRIDLARLVVDVYGLGYIGHPRLQNLIEKNRITSKDFLSGADEAIAFEERQYVRLHQSTLRKVDILANVFGRVMDGTLKTNARWYEPYGGALPAVRELTREHWVLSTLIAVGIAATIFRLWISNL
jgi:hypothetical protein